MQKNHAAVPYIAGVTEAQNLATLMLLCGRMRGCRKICVIYCGGLQDLYLMQTDFNSRRVKALLNTVLTVTQGSKHNFSAVFNPTGTADVVLSIKWSSCATL